MIRIIFVIETNDRRTMKQRMQQRQRMEQKMKQKLKERIESFLQNLKEWLVQTIYSFICFGIKVSQSVNVSLIVGVGVVITAYLAGLECIRPARCTYPLRTAPCKPNLQGSNTSLRGIVNMQWSQQPQCRIQRDRHNIWMSRVW